MRDRVAAKDATRASLLCRFEAWCNPEPELVTWVLPIAAEPAAPGADRVPLTRSPFVVVASPTSFVRGVWLLVGASCR